MIISGLKLKSHYPKIVTPFVERGVINGMSYGLSTAGYDVRIKQGMVLAPKQFSLASTIEEFDMPLDVLGMLHDKSTLARQGLSLFNTVLENGWKGFLTLELVNNSEKSICIEAGQPIGQVVFMRIEGDVEAYSGKYQSQPDNPVEAIYEGL